MSIRLLIVDDHAKVHMAIAAMIARIDDIDVVGQANDGEQAIAYIERAVAGQSPSIDLLLLDLNLPRRSGVDILKSLRSIDRYSETPVVVMTGSDAPKDREATAQDAVHYFVKPSTLAEFIRLGSLVRDILSGGIPEGSL